MPSLQAHAVKFVSRLRVKRAPKDREALVRHVRRAFGGAPIPPLLPKGVRLEAMEGPVPGDHLRVASPKRAILYLHGGGYVAGVTKTYHNLTSRLARALDADVFLPDYRLAPEHKFPAALEDAVAVYTWLLERGFSGDRIFIAGDSAGGGLTLATLLALRDRGLPMARAALALSPFTDMTLSSKSIRDNDATDAMLSRHMLELGHGLYVAEGDDPRQRYASPAFADFTGLPPLFLTVCEEECLRDDTYAVLARAREAGVPTTLVSRQDLLHVWPIFTPLLPEANEDLRKMIAFLRAV